MAKVASTVEVIRTITTSVVTQGSITSTSTPSAFPLAKVKQWTPNFKINALGIIALLGAEEINKSVGRLVRSKVLEYLPVIGSSTFASDAFASKQPGHQLYNFDESIYTPDLAGWFARWLMAQDFRTASCCVEWNIVENRKSFVSSYWNWVSIVVGFVLHAAFIVISVLQTDWWGCANACSMALSTLTRTYLLECNRVWLDNAVASRVTSYEEELEEERVKRTSQPKVHSGNSPAPNHLSRDCEEAAKEPIAGAGSDTSNEIKQVTASAGETPPDRPQRTAIPAQVEAVSTAIELMNSDKVKILIVLSDARAVALLIPRRLVKDCFVLTPKPQASRAGETRQTRTPIMPSRRKARDEKSESANYQLIAYKLVRWIAWLSFAGQVVSIGMSDLASQIITVVFIGLPTFCLVQKWGCDDTKVGKWLSAELIDIPHPTPVDSRIDIYAFLNLVDEGELKQETLLSVWNLTPYKESNTKWWEGFQVLKLLYNKDVQGRFKPLIDIKSSEERKKELEKRYRKHKGLDAEDEDEETGQHVGLDTP